MQRLDVAQVGVAQASRLRGLDRAMIDRKGKTHFKSKMIGMSLK
jgi:hypothetical protein